MDIEQDGCMLKEWCGRSDSIWLKGLGYSQYFVSDGTATVNDDLHIASLKNLAYGFAHLMSTDDLSRCLGN